MINRDRKCKTLTVKSKSHKKAKIMNSERQMERQTDRQKTYSQRDTDQQTVKEIMINRDRQCKTLTDKRKSHKKAKFMFLVLAHRKSLC